MTTIGVWSFLFYRSGFGHDKRYGFPESTWELPAGLEIPTMLPVVSITLASAVVLVVVSLLTRPPDSKTLAKFFPE